MHKDTYNKCLPLLSPAQHPYCACVNQIGGLESTFYYFVNKPCTYKYICVCPGLEQKPACLWVNPVCVWTRYVQKILRTRLYSPTKMYLKKRVTNIYNRKLVQRIWQHPSNCNSGLCYLSSKVHNVHFSKLWQFALQQGINEWNSIPHSEYERRKYWNSAEPNSIQWNSFITISNGRTEWLTK